MAIRSTKREKKVGNINVHLPADTELAVRRLAERAGVSASEYLHIVIAAHLDQKRQEFTVLAEIFAGDGSMSSYSSGGSA